MSLSLQMTIYITAFLTLCFAVYICIKNSREFNKQPKTVIVKEVDTINDNNNTTKSETFTNKPVEQITVGDLEEVKSIKEKASLKV